jgi:DNA-binding NarL/FixJ family response regulator
MKHAGSGKKPSRRRAIVLDILIAHDHEIVRIGLRALLKYRPGLRICGETSTTSDTIREVKKLQPHILLLKLDLPDQGALKIISQLLDLRPGLKILLFAAEGPSREARLAVLTPTVAQQALEQGVLGIVLKPDAQDIRLALEALSKNKSFISSNIFDGIASELAHRTEHVPSINDLTKREVEVFKYMATGRTTKEMATDLLNSPRTIEVHRANIMRKLGFHTQSDLILFALQHRVVELPQPTRSRSDT